MDEQEIPLHGGRVTPGVVRKGNTVRRPIRSDRRLVHALLQHLEQTSLDIAPRFLGIDPAGREILSFVEGEAPDDLGHYTDEQLKSAGALLRRFHDATTTFDPVVATGAEVICHNDWGPPNCIFLDGHPSGIIDFDTIAPGLRLWDLGYSAGAWLDLGNTDYTGIEQTRRLECFSSGYALQSCSPQAIAAYALSRRAALGTWAKAKGKVEMATWCSDTADWIARELLPHFLPSGFP